MLRPFPSHSGKIEAAVLTTARSSDKGGTAVHQPIRNSQRRGVTIIELLVVTAIIGMLTALLLSAVQQAREAARRMACKNNLKQLGLASHNYHDAYNTFPPGAVGPMPAFNLPQFDGLKDHGLGTYLLPYVDQQALYNEYRWDASCYDRENQDVVNTQLSVWQCPSAEADRIRYGNQPANIPPALESFIGTAACGDYAGMSFVDARLVPKVIARLVGPLDWRRNYEGVFTVNAARRLAHIRDGASNTILIGECSGRPQLWRGGTPVPDKLVGGGPWASRNLLWCAGAPSDGTAPFGRCAVNCTNNRELYSFHPGGANAVYADGSVHFLAAGIDIGVLAALVTRDGGEPPASNF
jgi:prepilin-type N-terminal cleavage/methylation domain-containing protein/prepilin-type processing-associated H-X9-DG protein